MCRWTVSKNAKRDFKGYCRVALLFLIAGIIFEEGALAQTSGDLMHRRHSAELERSLVGLFQEVALATKRGDWEAVGKQMQEISGEIGEYKKSFGIDMMPRLQKAVTTRNGAEVLKSLAQVIYLDMRAQFRAILSSKLDHFLDAKERLDLAKEYYVDILSGNVKRKAPERAQKIESEFVAAQGALGNPGFYIDLPPSPPDPKRFEEATKTIEAEIAAVYTYFKE